MKQIELRKKQAQMLNAYIKGESTYIHWNRHEGQSFALCLIGIIDAVKRKQPIFIVDHYKGTQRYVVSNSTMQRYNANLLFTVLHDVEGLEYKIKLISKRNHLHNYVTYGVELVIENADEITCTVVDKYFVIGKKTDLIDLLIKGEANEK